MKARHIFLFIGVTILVLGLVSGAAAAIDLPIGQDPVPEAPDATASRSGIPDATMPIAYESPADFSQGFDDITTLPGLGWYFQNNSNPLGLTDWFQGNAAVFPAHAGAPEAYIGANFNNTSGVGTISNWMLTPELVLNNGATFSFWTRTATGSTWPDRLQVRLSTTGSSTNVGTGAADVGDFTTLLLEVNPTLVVGGYPEVWTQYTITLSGIPGGSSGRIAFRYYVTDAGPSGSNSNYIGIDTVEFTDPPPSSIALSKTVGTDPLVCAPTDAITVTVGTEVNYCYTVSNTGGITLTLHDLQDTELGVILDDFPYALAPGASVYLTQTATINATTVNTATWTARTAVEFIDISASGTPLNLADDGEANVVIPFPFTFFGATSTDLRVGNNGGLLFGVTTREVPISNDSLPAAALAAPAILPYWDDLDSDTGNVYYATLGLTPNRQFIVQWHDRPHFSNIGSVTFEAILYEGSHVIEFRYLDTDFGDPLFNTGVAATSGLQESTLSAVQYSYNQPVLYSGFGLRFSLPAYAPQVLNAAIATDTALVNALFPEIDVAPASLISQQVPDSTVSKNLTISNLGDPMTTLNWDIVEAEPGLLERTGVQAAPEPIFEVPAAVTSKADCVAFENYPGAEPEGYAEYCSQPMEASISSPLSPTSTGYALNLRTPNRNLYQFTLNDFPGQTSVGPQASNIYAMDFDATATALYVLNSSTNELGTLSTTTGAYTAIIACLAPDGGTWTDLSINPVTNVFYASTPANLYTIDSATCSPTLIGPFNVVGGIMIDIAINPGGEMYGHDIVTDSVYSIDTSTGAATLVGLTGYLANFAQGMDFDNDDGTLYIFLYQGTGNNVYGTVDLTTGTVTPLAVNNPLGEYEGATQTTASVCVPEDIPWLSVSPITGTLSGGASQEVNVVFDSTGLPLDVYTGTLCVLSNDPVNRVLTVPLTMTVTDPAYLAVGHLAPFAVDPSTAVTVTLDGAPVLTGFEYGDSTGYLTLPEGVHQVAVWPAGSSSPAITSTLTLMPFTYYTAIASGDGANQPLSLLALQDDNSTPAAGNFKLRLGHLAPFADTITGTLADVRLQDGTPVITDVPFGAVAPYLELPAGTYDLKITTPGGAVTLIDPAPVTFNAGDIFSAIATGEASNQPLGVFAWPAGVPGFFLPLASYLEVAHLAPFAVDPGTAVTVTLDGAPVLTGFEFADSTVYLSIAPGDHLVEIFPAGSATPAITGTVSLSEGMYYSAVAVGDGANQPLGLLALLDDNSAPAAGNFKLRLGHLAPFTDTITGTLADVRLQDGTPVITDVVFGAVAAYLELPAGTYDLKITTPGGGTTLIDPLPVTFNAGYIVTALAVGDGANQPLGVFAWPAGVPGFLLPLAQPVSGDVFLPLVMNGFIVP